MKILQVVPYFYPAWRYGGPAKLVYDTSKYFSKNKHEVTVFTTDVYDEKSRMAEDKKIKAHHKLNVFYFATISNWLSAHFKFFIAPGMLLKALSVIPKIDVVHFHDLFTPTNAFLVLLCKAFKKPYVVSVHGSLESRALKNQSLLKNIFMHLYAKRILTSAKILIATSEPEFTSLLHAGAKPEQIVKIGHSVDPLEVSTDKTKAEARKHFSLPDHKVIFTFLGRINKLKGLEVLADAIKKTNSSTHFVIAGADDGYLAELQSLLTLEIADKKVTLLGTCFGEDKSLLFKASDVFIYPSYMEGFSLGILEAAAAGLPLLLTTGCNFELAEKQGAAKIITLSSENLLTAVNQVSQNTQLRNKMAKNAKKLIENYFSEEVINTQLLDLYKQVATQK